MKNPGLLVTEGEARGKYIKIPEKRAFWVGRNPDSDFVLEKDVKVSQKHCSFNREGSELKLVDKKSRNGTRVNGIKVEEEEVSLFNTDIVCIGETHLQVVDLEAIAEDEEELFAAPDFDKVKTSNSDDPAFLKKIGPYINIEVIGWGVNGLVYKAAHEETKKLFALKVMSDLESEHYDFDKRFQREMKLLKKLDHPSIIRLYDSGTIEIAHENFSYIALEYFQGVDLKDHLNLNGPMSWKKVFVILEQLINALIYMHSQGVLHRDLKPHNIMYNDIKQVAKIIDLGFGKCITATERTNLFTTQPNSMLGTPYFMPIEQWEDAKRVDERADLYSLGVSTYYLLTGQTPHGEHEDLYSLYQAIAKQTRIPLGQLIPEQIPLELQQMIHKMMAFNAKDRYSNANEILIDLKQFKEKI